MDIKTGKRIPEDELIFDRKKRQTNLINNEMSAFKYHPLPNIDSYQSPISGINTAIFPFNHDVNILAALEYKGIRDILILKGTQLEYAPTNWSILSCVLYCFCCCWNSCRQEREFVRARSGFLVRIPISINSSSHGTARDADYKLSYQTWSILNKPNFIFKNICNDGGFIYLGFELPLEDYIHYNVIIEKAKKMIEDMLIIF
jgi:hypothetical protein